MKYFKIILILIVITCQLTSAHDYCDVLKKSLMFYKANRAGRLPDNDIPWRSNSVLNDASPGSKRDSNGDGDLSKGYFDAGDHVKFALPMAYTITMLSWSFIEYQDNIEKCGLTNLFLEDIKWGSDWLIAAHLKENEFVAQVGNGQIDHSFWSFPEILPISMERPVYIISQSAPGTEVAMEAAAALAATSIIYQKRDSTYSSLCLTHAKQLHKFGDTYRGVYSDVITDAASFYKSWSGYKDEIVWGTIWLYKATQDPSLLSKAKSDYSSFGIGGMAQSNSHDWDLKAPGVSLLMYKLTNEQNYKNDIESHLKWWLPGSGGVSYTPGGLAWIRQWGPTRYASNTAFLASVFGGQVYLDFASKQVDYILGNNPLKFSYLIGYGRNFPLKAHHRGAHHSSNNDINNPLFNTYQLTGALVGGPSQDDSYSDDRNDYIRNEVACDYNAGFVGVVSALINSESRPIPTTQQPVATQLPITSKPITQPPVITQSPITSIPITQPPVITQLPITSKPITQPPVITQPPIASKPITQLPITLKPQQQQQKSNSDPNIVGIYVNGLLRNNFKDWSWGSSDEHSMNDQSHLYNGEASISFIPNNWNGLYFGIPDNLASISTGKFKAIEFYLNGGDENGKQQLTLGIFRRGGSAIFKSIPELLGEQIKPKVWSKVTFNFVENGIIDTYLINGIWLQSTTNGKQSTIYISNIQVV